MSSLTGIAQFTNRFAQNIMGYEEGKKVEAERVADKQYDRNRQDQQDIRTQQNHDVTYEGNQITLSQNKIRNKEFNDTTTYENTRNQLAYLKGIGADEQQSIDVLAKAVNSNEKLPYTVEFERDQAGKIIQRQGPDGKPFYFQTIIDKETGQELGRKGTTFDEATGNYTKLQHAGALEDEIASAQAARAAKVQEIDDKLTLKRGEAVIDDAKDANKSQRDHIYKVDEMGIKYGYTIDELGVKHGYTIDLEGVKHGNAVILANVNSQNRIGEYVGRSDIDAGGTPIVGGPATVGSIIQSLTGTESSGNSGAFRTNANGKSYGGLIQMGDDRLKDYAKVTGSRPISANQFKNLPAAQQRAVNEWHINDLIKAAQATGAVGKVINGTPVTIGGLVAVAHLGGKGGMNKFVQTNGRYNPKDQLGTSLTDYLSKHRSGGGVQVQRSVPGIPKAAKGSSKTKQADSGKGIVTAQDYNANIDKGVNTAIKGAKQLGVKSDAATTATFARAGTKLKEMGKAKSEREFLDLYQEAFDLVIGAVPERDSKKMSKADKNALGHKVLLSMVGASSLGNLKDIVYKINPSAKNGGSVTAGGLTLPGQQPQAPARQTPQTSKLQGLYARGLPAPKTDPQAQENLNYLGNLNDNIDW
ncbi:hypothetical protein [Psychrobacter vallis]|uniref:hypothetical protein n=1 Tax=Psychrobacter vallis TaxID=248451 RepID=UPI00191A3DA7|nr:hypothetical protein [Psychrobacter vallis]